MSVERGTRLAGKAGIVTGTGSESVGAIGSGKATAVLFGRQGAGVLVIDKVEANAEEARAQIEAEGGDAIAFTGDVTKAADCRAAVDAAIERFGRLDILVNNVAVPGFGTVVGVSEEEWNRTLAINLTSAMLMSKYAIPKMRDSGGGSIINVASVGWARTRGLNVAYTASKAGMVALARDIAVGYGAWAIRANTLVPGQMYSSFVASTLSEERRQERLNSNPLGREGTGWDIGWAAVFLASDEARWITGVDIPIDGGWMATRIGFDFQNFKPEA
jgi:NAD(P)-dependent dehydrogenase (short-subunit alcohol dehydrogenase family)